MDGDDDHSRAGGRNFTHDGHDGLDGLDDCDDEEDWEEDESECDPIGPEYWYPDYWFPYMLLGPDQIACTSWTHLLCLL